MFRIFGYYPPRPLRKSQKLYHLLKNQAVPVQEAELKSETIYLCRLDNHREYENLLQAFVTEWKKEKIEEAKFIGAGRAPANLNTYRKVKINDDYYFEKVFFDSSGRVDAINWFQQFVSPSLSHNIRIPAVKKIIHGTLLHIVYFDYLNLSALIGEEKKEEAIEISKILYTWSMTNQDKITASPIPKKITNFRKYSRFHSVIDTARMHLFKNDDEILAFEKRIDQSRKILAHGDLHAGNIFKDNTVIDWDGCGFFPIGLDPAVIHYYLIVENEIEPVESLDNWLITHYKNNVDAKDWGDFEINFLYFSYIQSFKLVNKEYFKQYNSALKEVFLEKWGK